MYVVVKMDNEKPPRPWIIVSQQEKYEDAIIDCSWWCAIQKQEVFKVLELTEPNVPEHRF